MQDVGVGVSVDEAAINTGRLGVFFALEVDQSEEVQDALIGRPHAPGRFELPFYDREVALLEILHSAVEMDKEQPWSNGVGALSAIGLCGLPILSILSGL